MEAVLAASFVAFVFLLFTFTLQLFLLNMDGLVVGVGFYLVLSHVFFVQTSKCLLRLLLGRGVKRTERWKIHDEMTYMEGAVR